MTMTEQNWNAADFRYLRTLTDIDALPALNPDYAHRRPAFGRRTFARPVGRRHRDLLALNGMLDGQHVLEDCWVGKAHKAKAAGDAGRTGHHDRISDLAKLLKVGVQLI